MAAGSSPICDRFGLQASSTANGTAGGLSAVAASGARQRARRRERRTFGARRQRGLRSDRASLVQCAAGIAERDSGRDPRATGKVPSSPTILPSSALPRAIRQVRRESGRTGGRCRACRRLRRARPPRAIEHRAEQCEKQIAQRGGQRFRPTVEASQRHGPVRNFVCGRGGHLLRRPSPLRSARRT